MPDTELFNRYRCLRAISTRHHSGALALGLPYGRTPSTESEEEMTLLSTGQFIQPSQADRVPSIAMRSQ